MNTKDFDSEQRDVASAEFARSIDALFSPGAHERPAARALRAARSRFNLAAAEYGAGGSSKNLTSGLGEATDLFGVLLIDLLFREDERIVRIEFGDRTTTIYARHCSDVVGPAIVAEAILTAWCARRWEDAAEFGSLPTPFYRNSESPPIGEVSMFWAFVLASAARGNRGAAERAMANCRAAAATQPKLKGRPRQGGKNRPSDDLGFVRGAVLPGLAAIEAIYAGNQVGLGRQIELLIRYHRWLYRESIDPRRSFDVTATGIARWAVAAGVRHGVQSLFVPLDDTGVDNEPESSDTLHGEPP